MKTNFRTPRIPSGCRRVCRVAAIATLLCLAPGYRALATGYAWDPSTDTGVQYGDGVWDTTTKNWGNIAWVNGTTSTANFGSETGAAPASMTITLGANIILNLMSQSSSCATNVIITGTNYTITFAGPTPIIANNNTTRSLTVAATLSGTDGITKMNGGTVIFAADNNYSGGTLIKGAGGGAGGALQIGAGGTTGSLGSGDVNFIANTQTAASVLAFNRSDAITVSNNIIVSNTFATVQQSGSNTLTLSGTQVLNGNLTYNIATAASAAGRDADITGVITGTGSLTKQGAGTLTLLANNTYTGATLVQTGTLAVSGTLAAASAISISSGATLAGSGRVNGTVTGTGAAIKGSGLSLGATTLNGLSSISGTTTASSIAIASGTTTASGVTTSSGTLAISAGATFKNTGSTSAAGVSVANTATLANNGSLTGPVNVNGVLSGTGAINGTLTVKTSGEFAPGNSPGIATISGSMTVENGAKISMQIAGTATAGSDFDQIVITGASSLVTLSAGAILNLTLDTAFTTGAITLIENQSNSAIAGTFSTVTVGGSNYDVSATNKFIYNGQEYELLYNVNSDGGAKANDLELAAVPEPGAWALLMGGAGLLAFGRRLKRRAHQG